MDEPSLEHSNHSYTEVVADILAHTTHVFGDVNNAKLWLTTINRSLDNHTPLSLLKTPHGVDSVKMVLGAIEYGGCV